MFRICLAEKYGTQKEPKKDEGKARYFKPVVLVLPPFLRLQQVHHEFSPNNDQNISI